MIQSDNILTAPTCTGSLHILWNITGVRVTLHVFSEGKCDRSSVTHLSTETGVLCSYIRTFPHLDSKDNRSIQHLLWVTLRFKVHVSARQEFHTVFQNMFIMSPGFQWSDYIIQAINTDTMCGLCIQLDTL
jgi:hypothetical protein